MVTFDNCDREYHMTQKSWISRV